eukprot:jgi/Mesen1/9876/ME000070S09166
MNEHIQHRENGQAMRRELWYDTSEDTLPRIDSDSAAINEDDKDPPAIPEEDLGRGADDDGKFNVRAEASPAVFSSSSSLYKAIEGLEEERLRNSDPESRGGSSIAITERLKLSDGDDASDRADRVADSHPMQGICSSLTMRDLVDSKEEPEPGMREQIDVEARPLSSFREGSRGVHQAGGITLGIEENLMRENRQRKKRKKKKWWHILSLRYTGAEQDQLSAKENRRGGARSSKRKAAGKDSSKQGNGGGKRHRLARLLGLGRKNRRREESLVRPADQLEERSAGGNDAVDEPDADADEGVGLSRTSGDDDHSDYHSASGDTLSMASNGLGYQDLSPDAGRPSMHALAEAMRRSPGAPAGVHGAPGLLSPLDIPHNSDTRLLPAQAHAGGSGSGSGRGTSYPPHHYPPFNDTLSPTGVRSGLKLGSNHAPGGQQQSPRPRPSRGDTSAMNGGTNEASSPCMSPPPHTHAAFPWNLYPRSKSDTPGVAESSRPLAQQDATAMYRESKSLDKGAGLGRHHLGGGEQQRALLEEGRSPQANEQQDREVSEGVGLGLHALCLPIRRGSNAPRGDGKSGREDSARGDGLGASSRDESTPRKLTQMIKKALPKMLGREDSGVDSPYPQPSQHHDGESDVFDGPSKPRVWVQPLAGSQVSRGEPNSDTPHCWATVDASTFKVRGKSYHKDKKKVPAGSSVVYEPLGVDVFRTASRTFHIARHVELPSVDSAADRVKGMPSMLVFNCQLPVYPPPFFQGEHPDGETVSVVLYFRLAPAFLLSVPPHIQTCLQRFMEDEVDMVKTRMGSESTVPFRERLKMVIRLVNVEGAGLGVAERRLLSAWQEKPVLTRPQHAFFRGNEVEELPEMVLCCLQMRCVDLLGFDYLQTEFSP